MSSKDGKNYPEPTPGEGTGPSGERSAPFPNNGGNYPINSNPTNHRNAGMNPSLFVPSMYRESNNNDTTSSDDNNGSPSRSSDIGYRYNTTHMDYRIAQAWIASAPAPATTNTTTAGPVVSPQSSTAGHRHRDYTDNYGPGEPHASAEPEEFLDEFADDSFVEGSSSPNHRKTPRHSHNSNNSDGAAIRNSFEGLRKNLFSPPSTGRQQQQQQQLTAQEVRGDEELEVRLSWRSENVFDSHMAKNDTNTNTNNNSGIKLDDSWLDLVANQDSMPSTPPSIPDDLIDLSPNEDDSGDINDDNDCKPPPMTIRQHSYGQNPVISRKDVFDRDDDDDGNDYPNNTSGGNTLEAVANPGVIAEDVSPFLWMRIPQSYIPDQIVLNDDQRANMEDEQLTGDGERPHEVVQKNAANNNSSSSGLLFRPPTLPGGPSRPMPVRGDDRQLTPQSWHTPIGSVSMSLMRPKNIISSGKRVISGGSRRTRGGSVPQSPGSRRSAKSERYYHSYETNLATPPRPVPPFVVVHNEGSAVVKVTPKKTTLVEARKRSQSEPAVTTGFEPFLPDLNEQERRRKKVQQQQNEADCGCDGEDTKTKTRIWCRNWGRPVSIALTSAVFVLALITVVTSLVASRNRKRDHEKQQLRPQVSKTTLWPSPALVPTESPAVFAPSEIESINNDLILDAAIDDDLNILWQDVVKRPYEETQNPAVNRPTLPTLPPRTYPPTASPSRDEEIIIPTSAPSMLPDNFPEFVPTNLPFLVPRTQEPTARADLLDINPYPQQIPWNNYVIGLLSVQSPNTFSFLDDDTSPQFLALLWISVDSSRKGGSSAYTMDASLQRFALATVYFSLNGPTTWFDDTSWLSTVVNVCDWKGITCDDSDTAVLSLDLANNGLSGSLPDELKLLKYLQTLNVPGNSIVGTLPPNYSILYDLEELNLSGNFLTGNLPQDYGGFGSFEMLKIFNLGSNQLEGSIPSELGDMPRLEIIILCSNALTGTIPSALGSLNELKFLKLGNNQLTGGLPSAVCDATSSALDVLVDCAVGCECCTRCCGGDDDDGSTTCC